MRQLIESLFGRTANRHRRNLSTTERMKLAERDRENRRLARSLAHATPAIDNRAEDTREFEIMQGATSGATTAAIGLGGRATTAETGRRVR